MDGINNYVVHGQDGAVNPDKRRTSGLESGCGVLFFYLYLCEHDLVYPTTVTFTERRERRYRVHITGSYRANAMCYDLRVEAWLDWVV
jgi:hypothetical protein